MAAANQDGKDVGDDDDDETPAAVAVVNGLWEENAESPPSAPEADGDDGDAEKKCLAGLAGRPLLASPAAAGDRSRRTGGGENLAPTGETPLLGRLAVLVGCPYHLVP